MNYTTLLDITNTKGILQYFSIIQDPRNGRHQLHKLIDILVIALCTIICGGTTCSDMEDLGLEKEEWLRQFLELPNGIPSHDTFRRVLAMLNPKELNKTFNTSVKKYLDDNVERIISIDGKTSRGSQDRKNGKNPLHLVNAWLHDSGIALGQVKVSEKSNEITAIPQILELINVKNSTITIDAMGCQKNIARKIIEKKGDYVFSLKGNQGTLKTDVELFFQESIKDKSIQDKLKWDYFETIEKGHGRIEKRRYLHTIDVSWLKDQNHDWDGLNSLCVVESTRKIDLNQTIELRYYISSYSKANAERIGKAIRAHWGIENQLHWVIDVSMGEDESRIRKDYGPENFAVLRKIALNALKSHKGNRKRSIKTKRKAAGWSNDVLAEILFGIEFI